METPIKMIIHESNLAEALLAEYQGQRVGVMSLISTMADHVEPALIAHAIRELETQAEVYVERRPVLKNGMIRKTILSTDIVYFKTFPTITRKTLLYKTGVEYGDFTINHLLGCAHGCRYPCYAMMMATRYGRVKGYADWMHPRIVENALELLDREIPRYKNKIDFVHLSFTTDPFMYDAVNERLFPWVKDMTLRIIKRLNDDDIKVTVLTKGLYPEDLTGNSYSPDNEYGISLVSLDTEFHNRYEPFSALPEDRIFALKQLHDAGWKTWVSIEPYPTPNIVKQNLRFLLEHVEFVDKIVFGRWNYNKTIDAYSDVTQFYTQCSDTVIEFCRERDIEFHIKEKTPRSSEDTRTLFRSEQST